MACLYADSSFNLEVRKQGIFLKYRRMISGERLLIQDQNGQRFETVLKSSGHDSLNFVPENPVAVLQASASRFEILQALPKEKALNLILQNTT